MMRIRLLRLIIPLAIAIVLASSLVFSLRPSSKRVRVSQNCGTRP